MDWIYFCFVGFGLAMDAFAVSVTSGISIKNMKIRHALIIAATFGAFQAIMPVIGWLIGGRAREFIITIDHWIAFALLGLIGAKMIYEGLKIDEQVEKESNPLNIHILFALAVATSIDALVVGLTLSVININIFLPVLIIGIITFIMSFSGVWLGNRYGHIFNTAKLEILGGLILIALGLKILIEHLINGC